MYIYFIFFTQRFDITVKHNLPFLRLLNTRQQLFLFVLAIVPSTNKFLKFSKLEILLIGLIVIGLTLSFPTVVFVELLVTTIFSDEVGLKKFIILALRGDGITSGISIIIFANTISTKEEELKRKGQRFKIQNECIFIYIYELQQCYEIKIYASYLRVPHSHLCIFVVGIICQLSIVNKTRR